MENKNLKRLNDLISLQNEIEENIKKKELLLESVEESIVNEVKNINIPYNPELMDIAILEFLSDQGIHYHTIENKIKQDFFYNNNQIEIVTFDKDYRCGYRIVFKYNNLTLDLFIPNVSLANDYRVKSMHYGQYVLRYLNEHDIWTQICEDYNIDCIAGEICDFIEENDF